MEEDLFNNSITLTNGNITFLFTGTAFYASLYLFGAASIIIDGQGEVTYNTTLEAILAGLGQPPIFSKSEMPNGPHTLVIAPTTKNGTLIEFDHLVYTAVLPTKSHVGAIVGGVIGGVVLTIGALFAALYAHRRKLIIRRNQRKTAVLRGMTAGRLVDHKPSPEDGTNLPICPGTEAAVGLKFSTTPTSHFKSGRNSTQESSNRKKEERGLALDQEFAWLNSWPFILSAYVVLCLAA
ncbi:hypothetical protein DFH07DRAFT_777513 [Mycena maculata]|uniref:Uncharacterized protein n=1 Tax=Mycena maculata TaxID=230809 RepID=A0AAD7N2N3_9AGAR|nr:hypothetical protein DFH07DRAFT_777513 [Mycena maculata]